MYSHWRAHVSRHVYRNKHRHAFRHEHRHEHRDLYICVYRCMCFQDFRKRGCGRRMHPPACNSWLQTWRTVWPRKLGAQAVLVATEVRSMHGVAFFPPVVTHHPQSSSTIIIHNHHPQSSSTLTIHDRPSLSHHYPSSSSNIACHHTSCIIMHHPASPILIHMIRIHHSPPIILNNS